MTRAERLRLGALTLAAGALWALYVKLSFVGFWGDAVYYLDPARNFARGLGVATNILYPAQIASSSLAISIPAPFLWHGPLAPIAIGLCYRLLDFVEWAPFVYSFGLTLLTGLLTYRFGRAVGGERVGLLAAALLWTNMIVFEANVGAFTDPLFGFFVALAAALLWRSKEGEATRWCAAAGIALGLASSTRLAGQVYWIGFIAAAAGLHRGWRPPAALIGGLVASLAPLALYNWQAGRVLLLSPGFYMLQWSNKFPGVAAQTSYFTLSSVQAVLAYPRDILQKAVTGPLYGVNALLEKAQAPYVMAMILLGLLVPAPQPEAERWRRMALWICAPVFAANLVLANGAVHYLQPLFALVLPCAAAFAAHFCGRHWPGLKRRPVFAAALAGWVFLSPLALELKAQAKTRAKRMEMYADLKAFGAFIKDRTKATEVLYTDEPTSVTWLSERPSVHLTFTLADAEKTFARVKPDALLLTSLRLDSTDYDAAFLRSFRDRAPVLGFHPCARFVSKTLEASLMRPLGACPEKSR